MLRLLELLNLDLYISCQRRVELEFGKKNIKSLFPKIVPPIIVLLLLFVYKVSEQQVIAKEPNDPNSDAIILDISSSLQYFSQVDTSDFIDITRKKQLPGDHYINPSAIEFEYPSFIECLAPDPFAEQHPDDIYWAEGFGPIGVNESGSWVNVITEYQGNIIIGGHFNIAGSAEVQNIASWDGSSWSPLCSGVFGDVTAIIEHEGKLIVGGTFKTIGNITVNHVAVWDGKNWSPLYNGVNGNVHTIEFYQGKIIVGGSFSAAGTVTCNRIAAWNGSEWTALGSGIYGAKKDVRALTIFDNKLVVGGAFEIAGGHVANNIAYWDGLNWSTLSTGISGRVRSLLVLNDKLYASGNFLSAGGSPVNYVASWDGSSWSSLGAGTNATILSTTIYNNELLVCGFFTAAGTDSTKYVARWDGNSWHAFDNGLRINRYMWSYAIATVSDKLFLGGRFVVHGGSRSFDYTSLQWKDSSWSPVLENGLSDWVFDIVEYDNKLIAGGYFNVAGGVQTYRIAAWDGKKWNSMSPYSNYWGLPLVTNFAVYENDLIVGGLFDSIGGIAARNIASWDGTTWTAMDTGIIVAAHGMIDYNGDLVVGGGAIGEPINQLLIWNGTSWSTLGRGVSGRYARIIDLIEFNGNLVVAGLFDSINGLPIRGIAQWNGNSWSSLGGRVGGHSFSAVYATAIYHGNLVAAGNFDSIGGIAANMIASWDGNKWTTLVTGKRSFSNIVAALTVHGGKLVVGGDFDSINGMPVNNIASFDGSEWSGLGSGISLSALSNQPGYGLRVMSLTSYNEDLYVSGDFSKAGDKISYFIAKWTKPSSVSLPEKISSVVLPEQLQLEQNYPNPFNPTTTIEFNLTNQSFVTLEIYNVLGQKVATLVNQDRPPGRNVIIWDGRTADGFQAASGIYFYKLTAGDYAESKKMLLLR